MAPNGGVAAKFGAVGIADLQRVDYIINRNCAVADLLLVFVNYYQHVVVVVVVFGLINQRFDVYHLQIIALPADYALKVVFCSRHWQNARIFD